MKRLLEIPPAYWLAVLLGVLALAIVGYDIHQLVMTPPGEDQKLLVLTPLALVFFAGVVVYVERRWP